MTSYDLLEAICNIDDELLMQSEITNKKNNLIKYISLSACAIIVVALVAVIGISNLSIDTHESVPDITASGTNVLDTPPSSSVIDISDSSVVDSQTEIENPAPPPFAYSGGDENAWFYEPLQPKIGHITASLSDYFQIDEFEKWAETVNVLYRKGENVPTEINDFLNVYAVIEYFDISDEQVKAAYEAEINMENEKNLLILAQNGDANAMWKLGNMYYFPKCDFEKALYWYNQALENGNNDAIISIARVYEQIDIQKAAKDMPNDSSEIEYELSENTICWYQKALKFYEDHCLDKAEYACLAGDLLSDEDAIDVDFKRAFAYYQFAANIDSDDEFEKLKEDIINTR